MGRCEEGPVARSSLGQVAGRLLICLHQDVAGRLLRHVNRTWTVSAGC